MQIKARAEVIINSPFTSLSPAPSRSQPDKQHTWLLRNRSTRRQRFAGALSSGGRQISQIRSDQGRAEREREV